MSRFKTFFDGAVRLGTLFATLWLFSGCESGNDIDEERDTGEIRSALVVEDDDHGVESVLFMVLEVWDSCYGEPLEWVKVPLEDEGLPDWLGPTGTGDGHPFADGLFVLEPGNYRVCAVPLDAYDKPSQSCKPATQTTTVFPGATTEIMLVMQCDGVDNGGLDAIAVFNHPPVIEDLEIAPSKFITVCQKAMLTVEASDPNGDDLSYYWWLLYAPPGADWHLYGNKAHAKFFTDTPGTYKLKVTVRDAFDAYTSLVFPIHVSDAECSPVAEESY